MLDSYLRQSSTWNPIDKARAEKLYIDKACVERLYDEFWRLMALELHKNH